MAALQRAEQILDLLQARGFVSVRALSELCGVSEMTIRRDLQQLEGQKRLQRTYGGAVLLPPATGTGPAAEPLNAGASASSDVSVGAPVPLDNFIAHRVDVLVAASIDPRFDAALLERCAQHRIPVIAESLVVTDGPGTGATSASTARKSIVSVDNYQAAHALGCWAGDYARRHFQGRARVLDLTYHFTNTQARSAGFIAGLREVLPTAEVALSLSAQADQQTAYRLTRDALDVDSQVNVIFAINDATALGAMAACREMGADPANLLIVTFGLEGDTLKNALLAGGYCRAGVAMFPEIVGPTCVEAAIAAYAGRRLPERLVTPHAVLTADTIEQFYDHDDGGWRIRWPALENRLPMPLDVEGAPAEPDGPRPARIGFVVPFLEHEWYQNLIAYMAAYTDRLGIALEVGDAAQVRKDDVALRVRSIARAAAALVQPGDVVLISGGATTLCLAEELAATSGKLTVITNALPVFEALRTAPHVTLVMTGGEYHSGGALLGPTAESALRELRADRLFLAVDEVSLGFGLSLANLAEVAVTQAMLRAAREVILLADHTRFGQESVAQVAPVTAIHRLITDNALPASARLELSKLGVEVITASA
jgi:DeoR family transcriptional regulator, fructose operon transcriptional repressor